MRKSSCGIPPYRKIAADLRDDITTGRLGPGARCASERQLAGRYKVARATARAAIRLLRDEGLLITQQGRGTFVHACRPDIPNTQASKGIYPAIRYTASTINDDALDALYKELALLRHLAATRGAHAPLSAVA